MHFYCRPEVVQTQEFFIKRVVSFPFRRRPFFDHLNGQFLTGFFPTYGIKITNDLYCAIMLIRCSIGC